MFDQTEIQLLFEALDALESKASMDALMMTMLTGILVPEEERPGLRDEYNSMIDKESQTVLKERIILLKAKLIGLKDKAMIDEFEL